VIIVLMPEGMAIGGSCDNARRAKLFIISCSEALRSDKGENNSDVTLVNV
jgi:hypothetical protein